MRAAMLLAGALLATTAGMAAAAPAVTIGTQSVITDLRLDDCTISKTNDFGTIWACPGYKGVPVMVADNNGRFAVSYGLKSTEERAAKQLLPRPGRPDGGIEWRLSNRGGAWTPFATILMFKLPAAGGKPAAQVLVVTRIAEGATCQIGYVDATADTEKALLLAELSADEAAPDFDCRQAPRRYGPFTAW